MISLTVTLEVLTNVIGLIANVKTPSICNGNHV